MTLTLSLTYIYVNTYHNYILFQPILYCIVLINHMFILYCIILIKSLSFIN